MAGSRNDITRTSLSGPLLAAALLLCAGLAWAIYDEEIGQRPWKGYQEQFRALFSAHLRSLRPAAASAEQAMHDSPELREIERQLDEAERTAAPRLQQIRAALTAIRARFETMAGPLQDARARIATLVLRPRSHHRPRCAPRDSAAHRPRAAGAAARRCGAVHAGRAGGAVQRVARRRGAAGQRGSARSAGPPRSCAGRETNTWPTMRAACVPNASTPHCGKWRRFRSPSGRSTCPSRSSSIGANPAISAFVSRSRGPLATRPGRGCLPGIRARRC